ncbi:response regulator receiver modulated diguanylate cyclase [Desulfosporosinus sp. I2]|nr:response regulator receiver modulated diguanylate cyclase [Desulfosporosinus sp. I2]
MEQKTEANNPVYSKGENQPLLLVLNDDPVLRLFLKYYFEKQNGMIIMELNSQMEALEYFYKEYPNCVIVNGSFISKMGIHVFESFSHLCQENYIPILITLDKDNLALRKECITLADDVMVYSNKLDDLVIRVIYHLKKRSRIMDQILIDPMTGVKNEKFLAQEVERQIKDMKRSYEQFSMVYAQLDDLSAVQKTYGYAFGHQIVKEFRGFYPK